MTTENSEKVTPRSVSIDAMRYYLRLPEKNYKVKLLLLLAIDVLMIISYNVLLQIKINSTRGGGTPPSRMLFVDLDVPLYVSALIYVTLSIVGFIAYCVLRNSVTILKWVIKGIKMILKLLNPFYPSARRYRDKRNQNDSMKEWNKEQKRIRKLTPFLSFKKSVIGINLIKYLVLLHVLFYGMWYMQFVDMDASKTYDIIKIQMAITVILYLLLSKEEEITNRLVTAQLKKAVSYYCDPIRKSLLSSNESELFYENFDVKTKKDESFKRGHFTRGIYNNQEVHYGVNVTVTDLKDGRKIYLQYTSNSDFEAWDTTDGILIITRLGLFTHK